MDGQDLESRLLEVVAKCVGVDPSEIDLDDGFVSDLGIDELDIIEIVTYAQTAFEVKIPDSYDPDVEPTVGHLLARVRTELGLPARREFASAAEAGPVESADAGRVILRCPGCYAESDHTKSRAGVVRCRTCRATFVNLGRLPLPNVDVIVSGVLSRPEAFTARPAALKDLPSWVCSWCCRNLGTRRRDPDARCQYCKCALQRYAAISLPAHCRGLPAEKIGAYREMAVGMFNEAATLYMLGRISLAEAQDFKAQSRGYSPPYPPTWWERLWRR